jgi:hypothetical protein
MTRTMLKNAAVMILAAVLAITALIVVNTEESHAEPYKYKVTIYSGEQGTFNGKKVWTKEYNAGEYCTEDLKTLGHKLNGGESQKYYAKGFRITGHDNDEAVAYPKLNFKVYEDVSYEVAYRIAGDMVKYVVNYVENGTNKKLHDSETYYGMVGDKPVVAYTYIEGYVPDAYNKGKTLQRDESKNVFTFTYSEGVAEEQNNQNNQNGQNNNANVGPQAPGTANNPAGTNVNPNANQNDGNANINDNAVPQVNPGNNDDNGNTPDQMIDDDPTPQGINSRSNVLLIGGLAGLLLLIMLILFFLNKKKKEQSADEASEE